MLEMKKLYSGEILEESDFKIIREIKWLKFKGPNATIQRLEKEKKAKITDA